MMRFFSGAWGGLVHLPDEHLNGTRVRLQPATMDNWKAWATLRERSRAFLTPWEPAWPADTLTRAAFARRVQRQRQEWNDDTAYSFLTFEKTSNLLVGGLSLGGIRRGVSQTVTIGYWVGEPYARLGYTREAVRLALNFAFTTLTLHRVEASCLPDNRASHGLLQGLGFTCEGLARGYLRIDGAWRDHLLYGLLKEDWR